MLERRILGERVCRECGTEREPHVQVVCGIEFHTFSSRCKRCDYLAKRRMHYRKNREAELERIRRVKAKKKAHYRSYSRKNAKKWRQKNPEKVRKQVRRRKERLKNAPGGPYEPTRYLDRVLLYGDACAYCVKKPAETLDHAVPVSRGGSNWPANIYPACFSCNSEKKDKILHKEWVPPYLRNKQK